MRLDGKIAVVSGGAGGIGAAIGRSLAAAGADVCLADIQDCAGIADEIGAMRRRALALSVDVTDGVAVRGMIASVVDAWGGIDIIVNAAGVSSYGSAQSIDETEWDRVLDINLRGTFLCCQAAIPELVKRPNARIINIGSLLGKNGGNARPWMNPDEQNASGNIVYGISKAGVHIMTLYLARELASHGITVNCIAPGPIVSAMTKAFPDSLKAIIPLGKLGRAEDVGQAAVFLASESAAFITGEILDMNGGMWGD